MHELWAVGPKHWMMLSLLLFTAILSAVEMYRQVSTAGRDDVQQAQLSRAILRTMEIDIRSVIYRDPPAEEEEATADSAEEASAEEEEHIDHRHGDLNEGER